MSLFAESAQKLVDTKNLSSYVYFLRI